MTDLEQKFFDAALMFAAAHAECDKIDADQDAVLDKGESMSEEQLENWGSRYDASDAAYNATKAVLMDAYRAMRGE